MKTKLTLTVRKSVIENAKKHSKKSGKSISKLFEEMFEGTEIKAIQPEPQRAAVRLLKLLKNSPSVKTLDDSEKLKAFIVAKYA